jgi:hypothetical protein
VNNCELVFVLLLSICYKYASVVITVIKHDINRKYCFATFMKWQERILSNLLNALFSICIHYPLCQRRTLWNVISCFLHGCTLSNVISCCSKVKHEITFNRINLTVVVSILVVDSPGFVCFTDFEFFSVFCIIFVTLDSFLSDRYFVVACYYIGWVNQ